jgi:hypothetical protein
MEYTIYIHHFYSKSLFYKIAHNTNERVFNIDENGIGFVEVKYKGNEIKFIFNPIINYNEDGLHLVDFFSAHSQRYIDPTYTPIIERDTLTDFAFLTKIHELIENKKGWIILFIRMEKIVGKYESSSIGFVNDLEEKIDKLKKHHIISDNVFLDELIKNKYDNHFFCLTNSIHQWNEVISIRWYYEYKNIFEKLNQPYDLCFSVRHHKKNRIDIINGLAKLNNDKIYLSRVDNSKNKQFNRFDTLVEKNINSNITKGNDFSDISWLQNVGEYQYLDYMMRILPMAKMHVLSESWDFKNGDYASNYLSEKTYGFLLAKIPFISTHPYPLEIIKKILNVENHPFYKEIKLINGDEEKFVEFVKLFMENFDNNYLLCKEWVQLAHNKLIEKIDKENSFLDLILNEFKNHNINKNIIKNLL